jgi:hypothetical protein
MPAPLDLITSESGCEPIFRGAGLERARSYCLWLLSATSDSG